MFNVTIKSKKAIPGLAKILLGIILIGTIIFAMYVQDQKRGDLELNLDSELTLSTDFGTINVSITSDWQEIPVTSGAINAQGVWQISQNKGKSDQSYFFINVLPSNPKPEHQIIDLAETNRWTSRINGSTLRMQEYVGNNPEYTMYDAIALFVDSSGKFVLSMKLIYLPNNITLALSTITPIEDQIKSGYWLDGISDTVRFSAAKITKPTAIKLNPEDSQRI